MSATKTSNPVSTEDQVRHRNRRSLWRISCVGILIAALLCWQGPALWIGIFHRLAIGAIHTHDPGTALYWLSWADLPGFSEPETSLIRIQAARRLGDGDLISAALSEAELRGADSQAIQRHRILYAAECGRMREAEPFLPTLLTDPLVDNTDVCLAYVTGFLRNQRSAEALSMIEAWMQDAPADPAPWFLRGRLRRLDRNLEEAESDLRQAVDLSTTWMEPVVELAQVLADTRRASEAATLFEKAMEDPRVRGRAAVGLAACLKTLGDAGKSTAVLRQELATSPDNIDARMELGRSELENSNFSEAAGSLEKVVEARSYDDEARFLLAECLRQTGREAEAEEHLAVVHDTRSALVELFSLSEQIEKDSRNEELLLRAGELMLKYSDPDAGIITLLAVVDLNPRNKEAHKMIADYYTLRGKDDPRLRELAEYHRTCFESVK